MDRVSRHPEKVAMRYKYLGIWRDITWAEYLEKVRHTCLGLMSLGVERRGSGGRDRGKSSGMALLGPCYYVIGAVTVGIYTTSSAHQCEYVVDHSGSKVFIAEDEEQLDKALFLGNGPRI